MTAKQAMYRLGLRGSQFWRIVWAGQAAGILVPMRYGPKCYRFDSQQIEALRTRYMVRDRRDLARLTDGRRRP
jgi:hypothetical protein